MKKYNYGILSTASIVPRYIKGIRTSDEGFVYGIASRDINKAKEFALANDIPNYYGSYESLIDDPNVDIVYIPLVNSLHYEYAKKAISALKHVVVEKPFVLSKDEASELFALAKDKNVFLMEAQKVVFLPTTIRTKQIIQDGLIGEVKYIETRQSYISNLPRKHWMNDLTMGGGALHGSIAYPVEFVETLFDTSIFTYTASFVQGEGSGDSLVNFNLKFDDILLSATICETCQFNDEAIIYGTKGKIIIPKFWKADKLELYVLDKCSIEEYKCESEFTYQINHINECLNLGLLNSPIMSGDMSIAMVEIMENLYKGYKPLNR